MPNRQYEAGDRFEKRVADDLRSDGYIVWQTRGSKSAADLIALKVGQVVLVQCKAGAATLDHEEWNGLASMARTCGGVPVIADRAGRAIRYRRITDWHEPHRHDWPAAAWTPDFAREGIA